MGRERHLHLERGKRDLPYGALDNLAVVSAAILLVGSTVFWLCALISRGATLSGYFFVYDGHFFGNDYFLPLAVIGKGDPWEAGLNYPAGAILFLKALHHMVPEGFSGIGEQSVLRTYLNSIMGYILFQVISSIIIAAFISLKLRASRKRTVVFVGAMLASGPFLYNWECGNIVIVAIALLFLYLMLYDSEHFGLRLLSYVLLGLSATLKIYPAVFAIMTVRSGHRREFILCIAIAAAAIILPFFFFDGLSSVQAFISAFFAESGMKPDWGLGYNYSLQNIIKSVSVFFGGYITGSITAVPKLVASFALLAEAVVTRKKSLSLLSLALICLLFPDFSYGYMFPLFIPALVELFNEGVYPTGDKGQERWTQVLPTVLITALFVPYPLPSLDGVNQMIGDYSGTMLYPLSGGHVVIMAAVAFLLVFCLLNLLSTAVQYINTRTKKLIGGGNDVGSNIR